MKKILNCLCKLKHEHEKMFRVMKLMTLFLLIGVVQITASVTAQSGKLDVQVANVQLSDLLWELQEESGIVFVYQTDDLEGIGNISINKKSVTIEQLLNELLANTNLDYTVDKEVVVISKKPPQAEVKPFIVIQQPQERTISGRVMDSNGAVIPGVSVLEEGTTNGVITDMDGEFSIQVPAYAKMLAFSFIGMKNKQVEIGQSTILTIILEEDILGLDEVVVTA